MFESLMKNNSLVLAACGLSIAALADTPPVSAQTVTVTIRVFTPGEPPVPIDAHIARRNGGNTITKWERTGDDGIARFQESDCLQTHYRIDPVFEALYVRVDEWNRCRADDIEVAMQPIGLSTTSVLFLQDDNTIAVAVPPAFQDAIAMVRVEYVSGEFGPAAKLSSHLAALYRDAGREEEARVFGELSVSATARYARDTYGGDDSGGPLIVAGAPGDGVQLTPGAFEAVQALQQSCGLPADGVVGWATMSCLPGGRDFRLPSAIAEATLTDR